MLALFPLLVLALAPSASQLPGMSDGQGGDATPTASTDASAADLPDWMPQESRIEWLYLSEVLKEEIGIQRRQTERQRMAAAALANLTNDNTDAAALQEARQKLSYEQETAQQIQARIDGIEAEMRALTSFFAWPNPLHWARSHALAVALLIVAWFVGLWLIGLAGRAIVRQAERDRRGRAADPEVVQRARTLVAVFRKSLRFVLGVVLFVMLLGEFGVNTTAVLAGLGLLGLAVSFGSQSLVKDLISGFFMLMEGQLAIGDVVSLNGTSGTVENFTLRVTQLRDASGAVHFLPNGSIGEVTNMTHEYSKAIVSVGASYREDPDEVMDVLREVLREFATSEDWKDDVLEEPVILGVDALGESDVAFKMSIKVSPGRQWAARRDILRRVKIAFDLHDIEIPFPQRVTYAAGEQPVSKVLARHRKADAAASHADVPPRGETDPDA